MEILKPLPWVIGFGIVGILARYFLDQWFRTFWDLPFPLSTFVINITGSLFIGYIAEISGGPSSLSPEYWTGIMVGLLGGFTTFSSFSLQTLQLFRLSLNLTAFVYLFGSPVLGLGAALLGTRMARILS